MRSLMHSVEAVLILAFLSICARCNAQGDTNNNTTIEEGEPTTLAESSWNSTKENPLITAVVLKTANPLNLHSFHPETIFKDGKLTGKWGSCAKEGVRFTDCVVLPTYADRLSLLYTFDTDRSQEYTFVEPSIEVLTNAAKPTIENFDHDGINFEFTVFFNCARKESGNSTEVFDLKIPILRNFSIETRFTKRCESGPHPYVEMGMKNGTKESIISRDTTPIEVASDVKSTEFFIRVLPPAVSIVHEEPQMNIDGSGVDAKLRGILQKTDVVQGNDLAWWLTYDCQKGIQANITVSVPIPPWDDLIVHVAKRCRGGAPHMLSIGTRPGKNDVVEMGEPTTAYNVTNMVGYTKGEARVVRKEENRMRLYIRNSNAAGKGDLHLGQLLTTVSDRKIVRVTALFSDRTELGVVHAGKGRMELVRFVCLQEGTAQVVFSLPVLNFPVVEFGVIKECAKPEAITRTGWQSIWTVRGLEDLFFLLAAIAVIVYCIRTRGKIPVIEQLRGHRYESVEAEG